MSGNVNVANYCNFGSNRTSNVRVNQGPGGNSSLSLAWGTDDNTQKPSVRSGSYQRESNSYGNQYQNSYKYDKGNNADNQKYNPITGNVAQNYNANNYQEPKYQEDNFNQNQNRYDPGDINQYYVQQKRQQGGYNQDNYDGYQNNSTNAVNNAYSAKPPVFSKRVENKTESNYDNNKQSIKVHQTPGGRQNFQIGGDYNYFKDDGGNDKIGGYKGNSPQKSDSYQALKNNYRNMVSNEPQQQNYQQEYQQKYMANNYANNSGNNNRSSSQNIYNNDPYQRNQTYGNYYQQQQQQQQQQTNQPRQPNNLQDVKFGYRVNQPPGGKSNITFG